MPKNYYDILGVPETASKDDIKKAFRRLAMKYHPDRNPNDTEAEKKFKDASEAHEILSDDQKRQQYDTMRKYGAYDQGTGFGQSSPGFDPSQFRSRFRFDDLGGFGSVADIFSSLFGGEDIFGQATAGGRRRRPSRGKDLLIRLSIDLREAVSGTTRTIVLKKPVTCPDCGGSGHDAAHGQQVCPECQGRGSVSFVHGGFSISRPCPRCLGKGVVDYRPCQTCRGEGAIKKKTKIKVKIPAGIEDKGRVRLRGMGYPGSNGGSKGDLIIAVNVKPDQKFHRSGKDIHTTVSISFPQAVLGARVPVKTLSKTVNVTIPPGTEHGTKLRLKGLGLSVNGSTGDLYVEAHIKVPRSVNDEQRRVLEELAKVI